MIEKVGSYVSESRSVALVQLVVTKKKIRRREKKIRKLGIEDQNLVHRFIKSKGPLSAGCMVKLELRLQGRIRTGEFRGEYQGSDKRASN